MTEIVMINKKDVLDIRVGLYHDPAAGYGDRKFLIVHTSKDKTFYLDLILGYELFNHASNHDMLEAFKQME